VDGAAADNLLADEVAVDNRQHVMISYHWDYQPTVLQLRDRLKSAGFKIWIDVEDLWAYEVC